MDRVVVMLGSAAPAMRRRLAPLAWCALETLFERARISDAGLVADASTRVVADELGVAKNTAHRALQTLCSAGLIEHAQARGEGGRFDTCVYRLTIPDNVLARHAGPAGAASRRSRGPSRVSARPAVAARPVGRSVDQLVLFPPA